MERFVYLMLFLLTVGTSCSRPRVALVLSGGGARGMAHVGVLKVLAENQIPIDLVVGNSMGAVVGGLYATGYDAKELEKEVRSLPWHEIFSDEPHRHHLSLDQKDMQDRFVITLPYRKGKVSLPTGLIQGNRLKKELRRLTWPVYETKDFSKLPIPFIAIATDILSGKAVQLKSGNLADSIQASMSLPSIFQPQKIDGRLLMDGMMVRNLPVEDAKKWGADVILAVDVGTELYPESELDSMVTIIDQSMSLMNAATNPYQRAMADVLIAPRVKEISTGDFGKYKKLIARGENATRQAMPQILKTLAQHGIEQASVKKRLPDMKKELMIQEVRFEGLEDVDRRILIGEFGKNIPRMMSFEEIEDTIDRLHGSQFFDWVSYELEQGILTVKVQEKGPGELNIGVNYNSDERMSFLLSSRFRFFGLKNIRSSLDAKFGRWNRIENNNVILLSRGITDVLGMRNTVYFQEVDVRPKNQFQFAEYNEFGADLIAGKLQNNNRGFGIGMRGRQFYLKDGYSHLNLAQEESILEFHGLFTYDSLDHTSFPKSGTIIHLEAYHAHKDLNSNYEFTKQALKLARYYPVNSSQTLYGVYKENRSIGAKTGLLTRNYLGGQGRNAWDDAHFVGYDRLSSGGDYSQSLLIAHQWETRPNIYLTTVFNAGMATDNKKDLYHSSKMKWAGGVELGMKARYGTAKAGVYHNREDTWSSYFSVGHRF